MPTGIIWDDRYLLHQPGRYHPESPERLLAIKKVVDGIAPLQKLQPRLATPEEISLIHDSAYVRRIQETAGHEIMLDMDTHVSPKSWEAASLAVGGMLTAVDWVVQINPPPLMGGDEGEGDRGHPLPNPPPSRGRGIKGRNVFAFVRPPGHHAEKSRAMGFCLFNNVAIAAEYALRRYNLKRILILDFDVHHGNGTQWAFYDRDDVFYESLHRYPFYPGTGGRKEEGSGKGKGFTLNVPFPGGEGDDEYLKAFDKEIIPVAKDYRPDLVLVSAGFDAHRLDPIGGMNLTGRGYASMAKAILQMAEEVCDGKVIMVLEGGYSLEGLAEGVGAVLKEMLIPE